MLASWLKLITYPYIVDHIMNKLHVPEGVQILMFPKKVQGIAMELVGFSSSKKAWNAETC